MAWLFALAFASATATGAVAEAETISRMSTCPFFTLVSDGTAPTCNGSNDGVAAVLEPTDGVGPYAYQWIGGPATREWHGVGAGTYTVIVMDMGQSGMACNMDVFINEPGPLTLFALNGVPPTCAGLCNGQAAPLLIGGNGGNTLTWSSGETGLTPSALCATFTLHVEDIKGCEFDTTVTFINAPDPIAIVPNVVHVACHGDDNGSIDVTLEGGTSPFDVAWSGPNGFTSSNTFIESLPPGTYTIDVEDANGCTESADITILENPELEAETIVSDNLCHGEAQGEIELDIDGGVAPYVTAWIGPNGFSSTEEDLSGLEAGLYEVTITDDANCTLIHQATVDEPLEIIVSVSGTDLGCFADFSGAATVSSHGGSEPHTYAWAGPDGFSATGSSIAGLAAGTYEVVVTDDEGCSETGTVVIDQPDLLTAGVALTEITCHDGADAEIILTPSGGTSPYDISWTGPNGFSSSLEHIAGLEAGDYTATITDVNGCVHDTLIHVANPTAIEISANIIHPSCNAGATGAINLSIAFGTEPYIYQWTGPNGYASTVESPANLVGGVYVLVVTDDNGCQATESFTVTPPDGITAGFDVTPVTCRGGSDGSILTTPDGGTPPYSYMWLGQAGFISTDADLFDIPAGGYNLMITDDNGCTAFFSVNVSQPNNTTVGHAMVSPTCFGDSDGSISLTVNGGTQPYSYDWTGPNGFSSTTRDILNLIAGTYFLEITDAAGCVTLREYTLDQPDELEISGEVTDVQCNGTLTGSVELSLSGGTPGYLYQWTGPNGFSTTSKDIFNVGPGTYTFVLTDILGCETSMIFEIDEPHALTADVEFEDISCYGETDGSISVDISGGSSPASIAWTGPNGFVSSDLDIDGLEAGTYMGVVTDANGCELTILQEIEEPEEMAFVLLTHSDITCFGEDDGTAEAAATGGNAPLTYAWTGPNGFASTNASLNGLSPGDYTLTVTDDRGCMMDTTLVVSEPDVLTAEITAVNPDCLTDNGSLEVQVNGGTVAVDYTYVWVDNGGNTVSTTSQALNLAPGTYTLTVTDDNGCTYTESTTLTRNTFNVSAFVEAVTCPGGNDGAIQVLPSNGVSPYTYNWTGPNGFASSAAGISDLESGNYAVVITDASGCSQTMDYDVSEPDAFTFNPTVQDESCFESADGSILLAPEGGHPDYTVEWTSPTGFAGSGLFVDQLEPGAYLAVITDQNGCTSDTLISILPAAELEVFFLHDDPDCYGAFSGEITASGNGGQAPYNYHWQGPNGFAGTGSTIDNLEAGTYVLTLSDVHACAITDTVELTQPDAISIETFTLSSHCMQADGQAYAEVTGGNGNFDFSWSDADGNHLTNDDTLSNVSSGLYVLTVTDALGCTAEDWVAITDLGGDIESDVTDVTCFAGSDGAIEITVTGGTEPFSYVWSDTTGEISVDQNVYGLPAGLYAVMVTDANDCIYTSDFEVESPLELAAHASIQDVSCMGGDGAILLEGEGGSQPYAVSWTGPDGYASSDFDIDQLAPGTYHYSLVDVNGCVLEGDLEVGVVPEIEVVADVVNPLCSEGATGGISVFPSGGLAPLEILWTGPDGFFSQSEVLTDLLPGTYELEIIDGAGCVFNATYALEAPQAFSADISVETPGCNLADGEIHAVLSGGEPGDTYVYTWTDDLGTVLGNDTFLIGVPAGTYGLSVENQNGCVWETEVQLSNPTGEVVATVTDETCTGSNDGEIFLEIDGITEPYTISWVGPDGFTSGDAHITQLAAGIYGYTVTGADGCSTVGEVPVDAPLPIVATFTTEGVCSGEANGSIVTETEGGTEPYEYAWTGPSGFSSDQPSIEGLAGGTYNLLIEDGSGCTAQFSVEIPESTPMEVEDIHEDISCFGAEDGSITLDIEGGIQPYDVQWQGPDGFSATGMQLTLLSAGTYTAVITDSLLCTLTYNVDISEPESITVEEDFVSPGCESEEFLGSISIFPENGTGGFFVSWTGPGGFSSTDFDLFNLQGGTYHYVVSDEEGCSVQDSIVLNTVIPMDLTVETIPASCFDTEDGSATVWVDGGLAPRTYAWTGPDGFASADSAVAGLAPGVYQITVIDSAGCELSESVEIGRPEELSAEILSWADATCETSADGFIRGGATGGTEPYSHSWLSGSGETLSDSAGVHNLLPGVYHYVVVDANGCSDTTEFVLVYVFDKTADAGMDIEVCEGDLPLVIVGSSASPGSFAWTYGGDTLSQNAELTIAGFDPGVYEFVLTAYDDLCSASDTLSVTIRENPMADAGPDKEVFIEERFVLGGNPTGEGGVQYTWYPEALGGFDVTAPNPEGYLLLTTEFVVTVIDGNGCLSRDTVVVEVLPDMHITSGFTPNGDGVNDTWIIDNIEQFPGCIVHVFNRWGESVYQSKGYAASEAWDGRHNGKDVPSGTYYYTIELNDPRFPEPFTGPLTIHR